MSNLFIFFCCISSVTASDCRSSCLRFLLCKDLVVTLIIDFLRKSLRWEIFRVLLEHFISEVMRK